MQFRERETDSKPPNHPQHLCGPIRAPGTLEVGGTFGNVKEAFKSSGSVGVKTNRDFHKPKREIKCTSNV